MFKFKPILKNRLQYYKCVFTAANKTGSYVKMGARRVVTVLWACDPSFHRKIDTNKKYDVSFVGTAYRERKRIIGKVGNVTTFGDFWGKTINAHPDVYGEDYIRVINETRINLNLQAKENTSADAPTMRTFELAGSGDSRFRSTYPLLFNISQ